MPRGANARKAPLGHGFGGSLLASKGGSFFASAEVAFRKRSRGVSGKQVLGKGSVGAEKCALF